MASSPAPPFRPLVLGALYPALDRGLGADVLAARALGGRALTVATSLVVAGHGRVTDVLEVPSDTVAAQVEHALATGQPTAAKVGIVGQAQSAIAAFDLLRRADRLGPLVLDLTLSGPVGEDLADGRVREALVSRMHVATLVTLRAADAALVAGMEIATLEDAQVAVQRLHLRGAGTVLLRLPALPASASGDGGGGADPYRANLLFDGSDFALFEAPDVPAAALAGASSALTLGILYALGRGAAIGDAVQQATAFAAQAVRLAPATPPGDAPAYVEAARLVYGV